MMKNATIVEVIESGQLDGLLSHWQPAFANKLMMMINTGFDTYY